MKITVFYRSREKSNQIISSAKSKLYNSEKIGLMIDWINLDKRNYIKYFSKLIEENSLPCKVYIFDDEEIISDYLTENYPDIKIINFSKNSSIDYNPSYHGYYDKDYKLDKQILDDYKSELKDKTMYKVDKLYFKVNKVDVAVYDILYNQNKIQDCYDTKEEADKALTEYLRQKLIDNKRSIDNYNSMVDRLETENKRIEKLLGN